MATPGSVARGDPPALAGVDVAGRPKAAACSRIQKCSLSQRIFSFWTSIAWPLTVVSLEAVSSDGTSKGM